MEETKQSLEPTEVASAPPAFVAPEPVGVFIDNKDDAPEVLISWTASEFIAHHKTTGWYGILALVTLGIAVLVYLLTRDPISTAVIIVGGSVFGVYAARQPRQLQYHLGYHGLQIGERFYSLQQFRSFDVVPEGAFSSIVLMPLKRFSPLTTIYYAPEDEERIIALLADQLPQADYSHDVVERLMRRIRF